MSVYSRRSSSSSSGRSNGSTVSVKSTDLNVPRSKSLSVVTYLAGGDPRRHKNLRRQKTTTEYDNGTYDVREQLFWVRDPYEATYYWASSGYDDYDDRSSVYSGGSSRAGSRRSGKHGGHRSRGGAPAGVPVQPMAPPPQQGQHMPMGMGGCVPMGMPMGGPPGGMPPQMGGMPPMMGGGGGGQGPMMGEDMVEDDDYSSVCSGESYSTSGSGSYGSAHPDAMPPHMMGGGGGMPGMPPHPHMGGMEGPPMQMPMPHMGGQPPMMGGHSPPVHYGGDSGGGDDMPEFFQIS